MFFLCSIYFCLSHQESSVDNKFGKFVTEVLFEWVQYRFDTLLKYFN